jgi:hypothetical protein
MLVSDFDELWLARPFRPFYVHTADGRAIFVRSPEFAWHAPANRIVWIAEGAGDARVRMVDLHLVTSLDIEGSNGLPSTPKDDGPEQS